MDEHRRVDARVAVEVMGWVVAWSDADMPEGWQLSDYQEHPSYSSGTYNFNLPHFSTSIEAAWTVESEIERRGLQSRYISELGAILDRYGAETHTMVTMFSYVHATPEQRCCAALAAVEPR